MPSWARVVFVNLSSPYRGVHLPGACGRPPTTTPADISTSADITSAVAAKPLEDPDAGDKRLTRMLSTADQLLAFLANPRPGRPRFRPLSPDVPLGCDAMAPSVDRSWRGLEIKVAGGLILTNLRVP